MIARICIVSLLAILFVPVFSAAEEEEEKPKTIEDHMNVINDNYKALRRTARRKKFTEKSIEQAGRMIENAKSACKLDPPMAERFEGEEKKKFLADYREEMHGLIEEFEKVKTLLEEKEYDEAADQINKLNELKTRGHEKFVEE